MLGGSTLQGGTERDLWYLALLLTYEFSIDCISRTESAHHTFTVCLFSDGVLNISCVVANSITHQYQFRLSECRF